MSKPVMATSTSLLFENLLHVTHGEQILGAKNICGAGRTQVCSYCNCKRGKDVMGGGFAPHPYLPSLIVIEKQQKNDHFSSYA
jgi:hypothetical protein